MTNKVFQSVYIMKLSVLSIFVAAALFTGCAVAAKNQDEAPARKADGAEKTVAVKTETKNSLGKGWIQIATDSPADAVRTFYKNLREKRFREALMITNLRPAIEGLSEAEMQDLRSDFEPLAYQVPAEIQINGEIISGNSATVTAKMPDEDTGVLELKEFKLRRENNNWIILTVDEAAEKTVKKEGKNYFFTLRLEVHHSETHAMMERIAKAQMVYALQNGGQYADMKTLISQNLLPADIQNVESTGYRFNISTSSDKKKYRATAEPAIYGKTGKYSFLLELNEKDKKSHLKYEDAKGEPVKAKKL
jgi:hypothetical protein